MKLVLRNDYDAFFPEFLFPGRDHGGLCVEHVAKRFGVSKRAPAIELSVRHVSCCPRATVGHCHLELTVDTKLDGGRVHFGGGAQEYLTRGTMQSLARLGITPGHYWVRIREVSL